MALHELIWHSMTLELSWTAAVMRCWFWAEISRLAQMVIDSTPEPLSRPLCLILFLFLGHQNLFLCSFWSLWNPDWKVEVDPSRNKAHLSSPKETYCHRVQRWAFACPLSVPGRCSLTINISFPCKTNSYTSFLPQALLLTATRRVVCDGCRGTQERKMACWEQS